eukprot:c15930_g1_i3.p1 GENE.c15930_g1_i3~~c15930_g1_i3.p1  ORF type:complete len:286 (-),score=45.63 c15930_g1_i3:29-886(-)
MISLGAVGVPAVTATILVGITATKWLNRRTGNSEKLGALIAAGTSICGVTAITALAPAIRASPQETAAAVATVVAFGTVSMLLYPHMAHHMFAHPEQVGMFLGLAVHDTAQVIGSAMTYKEVYGSTIALDVAAVTKLTRNLFLAVVVPLLAWQTARSQNETPNVQFSLAGIRKFVPGFVVCFVGMAGLRSLGDFLIERNGDVLGLLDKAQWKQIVDVVGTQVAGALMGTAMAAVGLSTNLRSLRGLGVAPFAVGIGGALAVSLTGFCVAYFLPIQRAEPVKNLQT